MKEEGKRGGIKVTEKKSRHPRYSTDLRTSQEKERKTSKDEGGKKEDLRRRTLTAIKASGAR